MGAFDDERTSSGAPLHFGKRRSQWLVSNISQGAGAASMPTPVCMASVTMAGAAPSPSQQPVANGAPQLELLPVGTHRGQFYGDTQRRRQHLTVPCRGPVPTKPMRDREPHSLCRPTHREVYVPIRVGWPACEALGGVRHSRASHGIRCVTWPVPREGRPQSLPTALPAP